MNSIFHSLQDNQLKNLIVAIKTSILKDMPETNEHSRMLLRELKKVASENIESTLFLQCQKAVGLVIKSRNARFTDKNSLLAAAMNEFNLALKSIDDSGQKSAQKEPAQKSNSTGVCLSI